MTKQALVIIDFINDISHPKGKIASSANYIAQHQVINNVNAAIHYARQNKIILIFVKIAFQDGYLDCPKQSPLFQKVVQLQALQANTWGTEFLQDLNFNEQDYHFTKPRVSAFYATPLEAVLKANQVEEIFIAGVSTDMTVTHTTRDAHDRDYKVVVLADACAAMNEETQANALRLLERIATIRNSSDL